MSGPSLARNAGSFRDPSGFVYQQDDAILRSVTPAGQQAYEAIRHASVVLQQQKSGHLIEATEQSPADWPVQLSNSAYVLQHPKIPFISYPYEWTFEHLKAAALLHLDLHIALLEDDITLSDATAYNVQFSGAEPVFIDYLSLRPYAQGEYWSGHRQFCEQFLNPLLLHALVGVTHNAWFRGSMEGIATADLAKLIPLRSRLSWNVLTQVVLQSMLQQTALRKPTNSLEKAKSLGEFPKSSYVGLLTQLRDWIAKLSSRCSEKTAWSDYAHDNSYADDEAKAKYRFISEFAASVKPAVLLDFGCNTGNYTEAALLAGAGYAVGFDFDHAAVEQALARARASSLRFLPLWMDASNPSPAQGWRQQERLSLTDRIDADALIALAFEHHLSIAKNAPLNEVVDWLVAMAPSGVIEFVPKDDPTVRQMLALRQDIFDNYSAETFVRLVEARARIVRTEVVSRSGRLLIWYNRGPLRFQ